MMIPIRDELRQRGMLAEVEALCLAHQITVEELTGSARGSQRVIACRRDVIRWLRTLPSAWSWQEIGRLLRKSHTVLFRYFRDGERP